LKFVPPLAVRAGDRTSSYLPHERQAEERYLLIVGRERRRLRWVMNIARSVSQSLRHALRAKAKGQLTREVYGVVIQINHVRTVKEQANFVQNTAMIGVNLPSAVKMLRVGGKICATKKLSRRRIHYAM
jgi:hypothetical protein